MTQSLTITPGATLTAQPAPTGDTLTLVIPSSSSGSATVSYQGGVQSLVNPGQPSPKLVLSGHPGQISLSWRTPQNTQESARVTLLGMPQHSWPAPTPAPVYTDINLPLPAPFQTPPPVAHAPVASTSTNTATPVPPTSTGTSTTITTTAQGPVTSSAAPPSSMGRTVALVAAGMSVAALATYGVWRYRKGGKRRR